MLILYRLWCPSSTPLSLLRYGAWGVHSVIPEPSPGRKRKVWPGTCGKREIRGMDETGVHYEKQWKYAYENNRGNL